MTDQLSSEVDAFVDRVIAAIRALDS